MVLLSRKSKNIYFKWKYLYVLRSFLYFEYVDKHETLSPWEDHKFRVNLRNLGLWRHAPYIYEQVLIRFTYLSRERLTISNLYFMHKVHESLLLVFIDPIGFTFDNISNFIISRHCCGVGFWSKCWAKWAA